MDAAPSVQFWTCAVSVTASGALDEVVVEDGDVERIGGLAGRDGHRRRQQDLLVSLEVRMTATSLAGGALTKTAPALVNSPCPFVAVAGAVNVKRGRFVVVHGHRRTGIAIT